jgi:hypothetical protein
MNIANGTSKSHFKYAFSERVIFQIRSAEPLNENGAEMITFSDSNWLFMRNIPQIVLLMLLVHSLQYFQVTVLRLR